MADDIQVGISDNQILNDPSIESSSFQHMKDFALMVETILGGAEKMRSAGEKLLPRFQNEQPANAVDGKRYDPYEVRRKHAPFTNIYEDVSRSLASKPFSRELSLKDDAPQQYKDLAEDIDGQGNNLHVFAAEFFKAGIDYAISWLLIDYPEAMPRADGQVLSIADEKAQGLRPYWVFIPWDRIIAVYSDFVNGEEIVTHARILEPSVEVDGFVERIVQRIRILHREPVQYDLAGKPLVYGPPTWRILELVVDPTSNKGAWTEIASGAFTIDVIPLVKFVTGKRHGTTFIFDPPLRTLAYMQIQEYQQESNLKNIMELTCFPMLSGQGVTPPDDTNTAVPVGPRAVLYGGATADGRPGQWQFIEPSAQSIKTVMDKLQKTQDDMRELGMQPLVQTNLTVITTGQVAVKANSAVQSWAIRFKDALEQAWKLTARWLGDKDGPEVEVYTDFSAIMKDASAMQQLVAMRAAKDLSRNALLAAAMRFDYLPTDFDLDQNDQELAEEQKGNELVPEVAIDPITGKPIVPPVASARFGPGGRPPIAPPGATVQ